MPKVTFTVDFSDVPQKVRDEMELLESYQGARLLTLEGAGEVLWTYTALYGPIAEPEEHDEDTGKVTKEATSRPRTKGEVMDELLDRLMTIVENEVNAFKQQEARKQVEAAVALMKMEKVAV